MATYPSKFFSYDKETQVATVEASMLRQGFHQVYPDALDLGFKINSSHTGRDIEVVMSHEERRHGDIQYWDFVVTGESARKHPQLKKMKVRVYND